MSRLAQAAPAVKEALPAKVAIAGPAGSGKTYSALLAAEVFADGGRILVIDTERRSASLYADRATFETIDWWPPYDPRELAATLADAAKHYAVIVIDSLSHFWFGEGGTLDIVDDASKRTRGNSYVGWKEGTPAQEGMYEAILAAPCHVICCLRSKTEYVLETDSRGKQVPRKVGMAPVQREGVEYQFTVQLDLDFEHNAIVGKTRCPLLSDKVFGTGKTKEWAATLLAWLNDGTAGDPVAPESDRAAIVGRLNAMDPETRGAAKHQFAAHFGHPDTLKASRVEDAYALVTRFEATAQDRAGSTEAPPGRGTDDVGHDPAAGATPPPTASGGEPEATPQPPGSPPLPENKRTQLLMRYAEAGLSARDARLAHASEWLGREVATFSELTTDDGRILLDALRDAPVAPTLLEAGA